MPDQDTGHHLAAIVNADVVGYADHMARDEAATVAAVRAARVLAEELSARHRGRLVDFTGDNFLAEFASAVEAVRFAVAYQASSKDPDAMRVRMGVHLGDVLEEDGRLYGSGINMAARLQALAAPGGVCASAAVVEQVEGKLDLSFEDAGEHVLKSIPRPVRVFHYPRRSGVDARSLGAARPRARGVRARHPYVGRASVLERLEAALDDAFEGRGALVWLSGEPGIGKTRTVEELVASAERRGAEVLWGRSLEGEGAPPLWPWMQILGAASRARDAERLLRDLAGDAPHVAKVVPEVRERLPEVEEAPGFEPAEQQTLFFGSVGRFLARAAERIAVVVVLEDLHAADDSSLKLLRTVAPALRGTRVMLLGTTREAPLQTRAVLQETWADLQRLPHSVGSIRLEGLAADEVRELVGQWSSRAATPGGVAALMTRTDGNPLFVRELVQLMGSEKEAGAGVPPNVQAVVRELAGSLSEATRDVLAGASVVGRESSVAVLEKALGLAEETLFDALEECEGVGLASEQDGRLRFAHALFQEALYDAIPRRRRAQLHRWVGQAIEVVESAHLDQSAAALSFHFGRAGKKEREKAIEYARQAGACAHSQLGFAEAARHYRVALERLESIGESQSPRVGEILAALAKALESGGSVEAKDVRSRAVALGRALADPELVVRSVGGLQDPWDPQPFGEALDDALRLLGDERSALRATALAQRSYITYASGEFQLGLEQSTKAVEVAREAGDPGALYTALMARSMHAPDTPDKEEAHSILAERLSLALAENHRRHEFYSRLGIACRCIGDFDPEGFERELARCREIASELPEHPEAYELTELDAARALWKGQLDEAERLNSRALEMGVRFQSTQALARAGGRTALLLAMRGRWSVLESAARTGVTQLPMTEAPRILLALALVEQGKVEEGRREFGWIAGRGFDDLRRDPSYRFNLVFLSEIASRLGDTERASLLHRLLLPWEESYVTAGPSLFAGCTMRYLGLLDATLGRLDEAEQRLRRAIEIEQHMEARPWEAYARFDLARVLAERRAGRDQGSAREELQRALAIARDVGMQGILGKAEALRD